MRRDWVDFWLELIGTLLVVGLLFVGIWVILSYFITSIAGRA